MKKIALSLFCLVIFVYSFAQQLNDSADNSNDIMRSNGKIYVVLAVVVTIVIGLFIYLINLDRKIKKLEK